METSIDPIEVLKDELRRMDSFYSFWDRRVDIESNYIRELEGLIFDVPGPAGSLKDALDAMNALVRIEIDRRIVALEVFRDLRGDRKGGSSPTGGREYTSNWLISVANDLQKRITDLAEEKTEVTSLEETTEKATLTMTEETTEKTTLIMPAETVRRCNDNPSTSTRLLLKKHKNQPPLRSQTVKRCNDNPSTSTRLLFQKDKNQPSPSLTVPPSFTLFGQADRQYRNSVVLYNYLKKRYLKESMQKAEKLVTKMFESATRIQRMIGAFADSQSDLANALNCCSSKCRLMADNISPSTESNDFLLRVESGISAEFGRPHLYRNLWFAGRDNQQLPTILFGRPIPKSDSKNTTVMRAFKVLLKHNPLLSFGPSQHLSEEDFEQLSKSAHELESCWEPRMTDGGVEVERLLTTQPMCRKLLLHFLIHMPEPLMDVPLKVFYDGSIGDFLAFLCDRCNGGLPFQREMLSMVLHMLADSSKDESGVQWAWWDRDERNKLWSRALARKEDSMIYMLPLWVHCFEYLEKGEFVFLRVKMLRLQQSWREWVGERS